jgi:hypothetical protein
MTIRVTKLPQVPKASWKSVGAGLGPHKCETKKTLGDSH